MPFAAVEELSLLFGRETIVTTLAYFVENQVYFGLIFAFPAVIVPILLPIVVGVPVVLRPGVPEFVAMCPVIPASF